MARIIGITIHYEEDDGRITERHIDPSRVDVIVLNPDALETLTGARVEMEPVDSDPRISPRHPGEPPHPFGNPRISWGLCIYDPVTGRIICVADPARPGEQG